MVPKWEHPAHQLRTAAGAALHSEIFGDAFPVDPGMWNVLEEGKKLFDQVKENPGRW